MREAVGFLVKETEEPADRSRMITTDAHVRFVNFQKASSNQYLEFDIQVRSAVTNTYVQQLKFRVQYSLNAFEQNLSSVSGGLTLTAVSPFITYSPTGSSTATYYAPYSFGIPGNNKSL